MIDGIYFQVVLWESLYNLRTNKAVKKYRKVKILFPIRFQDTLGSNFFKVAYSSVH